MNTSSAQADLETLIDSTLTEDLPILIAGETGNAVLLPESHWNGNREKLHLLSIPGMRESLLEGMAEPAAGCATTIELQDNDGRSQPKQH